MPHDDKIELTRRQIIAITPAVAAWQQARTLEAQAQQRRRQAEHEMLSMADFLAPSDDWVFDPDQMVLTRKPPQPKMERNMKPAPLGADVARAAAPAEDVAIHEQES